MRLLFICKRHPQQRDLIDRPYGRFCQLPAYLASLGHTVAVATCSYRRLASLDITRENVAWSSDDILSLGPSRFFRVLQKRASAFGPDWIIGCSDAWFGPLAQHLARRTEARLAVDAYDNYESYMRWNLPLHMAWRRALRAADRLTAAGPQLAALMQRTRRDDQRPVDIVPMAADAMFVPHDQRIARRKLGLTEDVPLVGYMGSWAANRGTRVLLEAFRRVRARHPDARLVLTGRPPAHAVAADGVLTLGYVDDSLMPFVLSALDVACVVTMPTAFGRYSYPAKLCEAMACGIPVVATATEPVRWMLRNDPRFLVPPGDAGMIASRIVANLSLGRVVYPALPTWKDSAMSFCTALSAAV